MQSKEVIMRQSTNPENHIGSDHSYHDLSDNMEDP